MYRQLKQTVRQCLFFFFDFRPMVEVLNNSVNSKFLNDELEYNKSPSGKMTMSSDFQRKYDEWQIKVIIIYLKP